MFDFSSTNGLNWDEAMLLSPGLWASEPTMSRVEDLTVATQQANDQLALQQPSYPHRNIVQNLSMTSSRDPGSGPTAQTSASPFSNESTITTIGPDDHLIETFLQMLMPPILIPVEVGPKWASTRAFFAAMAEESSLVRSAIAAFAAVQMQRTAVSQGESVTAEWQPLYEVAHRQLSLVLAKRASGADDNKSALKYILTSLFLLIYTDLLTKTIPRAHSNLRDAYNLIRRANKNTLTVPERRLISWIRLLDGRAVSTAGGEGLFLADNDETLFDASPAAEAPTESVLQDTSIEEILFDVLYHPGILFYQKVQSFVGRVTRIDPWHRPRGTVQDETEVMAIGEQISKDLKSLYNQRPALMDHCVAGNLTEKYLAKDLATALTRSFRTYLANYYASFIHLHRVAYVQYPKTSEVKMAIDNVKSLSHSMAESDEALPVNLLWPLMMWGCEEESLVERQWISESIRSLEAIATNAKVTADLLEEVQRRQDEAKKRIDVRSVSHECFASYHFAIV